MTRQAEQSANAATEVAKQAQMNRQKKKSGQNFARKYGMYAVYAVLGGLLITGLIAVMLPSGKKLTDLVISSEEIATFNEQNHSFKVGANDFFSNMTVGKAQELLGNQLTHKKSLIQCPSKLDQNIIDVAYNFHTKFPHCVRPIVDQGKQCSSSYSTAVVSSVSDRLCAESDGAFNRGLSAQQFISCYEKDSYKCKGGFVSKTFQKGKTVGFVTEECLPYHGTSSNEGCNKLGKCESIKIYDYCVSSTTEGIKREIMLNGPVVVMIAVNSDFLIYSQGIFKFVEPSKQIYGMQAVKIIGWDQDTSTHESYWIIENSWGESWGIDGLAWIQMDNSDLVLGNYALSSISLDQYKQAQVLEKPLSESQNELKYE